METWKKDCLVRKDGEEEMLSKLEENREEEKKGKEREKYIEQEKKNVR